MVFAALSKDTKKQPAKLREIFELMGNPKSEDAEFVAKAYEFAKKAHHGQKRMSGDPYFSHVVTTAIYLAKIGMGPNMVAAGLLHDTVEDGKADPEEILEVFGEDVLHLVEGVTKLGKVRYRGMKRHTESLRKLFAATSQDVRVMIIKLMDRLHNAQTLEHVPSEKRHRIAVETIEIYAPIADRLGMGVIKRELEDAVFPYAYPERHKETVKLFKEAGGEDAKRLDRIHNAVRKKLAEYGVKDFVTETRLKGLYSFFKKLERKDNDFTKIKDIWALRVIVPTVADCYTVLGVVHAEWKPLPGRIKDYIAFPKPNGYQTLHTTIHTGDGNALEVQIRTREMHNEAQFGIASHFAYKERKPVNAPKDTSAGMQWIRQFIPSRLVFEQTPARDRDTDPKYSSEGAPAWVQHIADAREMQNPKGLEEIKGDFFSHRVFVFTPSGDVIDLPIDSTPIDFAYAVHSEIGNHISGAKVNGKMTGLDSHLQNGDIVEVITSKSAKPSRKWLDMVKTTMAKRHIRTVLQKARES